MTARKAGSTNGLLARTRMVKQALRLDHLYHLTGAHGLYQHATGADPNPEFGYCLDDNVRALMMALRAHALTGKAEVLDYAERYLAFVEQAQRPDGRFRNFMDAQGAWLEEVGSDDSNGRAVWGLGFAARYGPTARCATEPCACWNDPFQPSRRTPFHGPR